MPRLWNPIIVDAATIKRIRTRLCLTQTQFAEALEVTKRTVIRWEQSGAKFDRYSVGRHGKTHYWGGGRVKAPFDLLIPLAKQARARLPKWKK